MEIETKKLQDFPLATMSDTLNLLTDGGRITVGDIVSRVDENINDKFYQTQDGMAYLREGRNPFFGIKMQLVSNGKYIEEYAYLVFEKDAKGNISPAYLTEEEFDAIS